MDWVLAWALLMAGLLAVVELLGDALEDVLGSMSEGRADSRLWLYLSRKRPAAAVEHAGSAPKTDDKKNTTQVTTSTVATPDDTTSGPDDDDTSVTDSDEDEEEEPEDADDDNDDDDDLWYTIPSMHQLQARYRLDAHPAHVFPHRLRRDWPHQLHVQFYPKRSDKRLDKTLNNTLHKTPDGPLPPVWVAKFWGFTSNVAHLMRTGFVFGPDNVVRAHSSFVPRCPWVQEEEEGGPGIGVPARRYLMVDRDDTPPRWNGCLVVFATNTGSSSDRVGALADFRVADLTHRRVRVFKAYSHQGYRVYQYDAASPASSINVIYDGMPLRGLWPWPKKRNKDKTRHKGGREPTTGPVAKERNDAATQTPEGTTPDVDVGDGENAGDVNERSNAA